MPGSRKGTWPRERDCGGKIRGGAHFDLASRSFESDTLVWVENAFRREGISPERNGRREEPLSLLSLATLREHEGQTK